MDSRRMSHNYKLLRSIRSKTRQIDMSQDTSYIIIYAFLYKYCSDMLKDHFMGVIQDREITLDEAFQDSGCLMEFRDDAFKMFGYYIPSSDLFLDELINEKYTQSFFIHEFIEAFSNNVEFPPDSLYEQYFRFIFDSLKMGMNINKFEFEGENHLIVKDLIYTISKLDIFEREFPFERVFDKICDFQVINVDRDPEYINSIISAIVTSQKNTLENVYNPFLNDASSLIDLTRRYESGITHVYGRGNDMKSYCAGIVKFLISYFDLDNVFLNYGGSWGSVEVAGVEFDAILSCIPPITQRRFRRINSIQNDEILKRNNKKKVKSLMAENLGLDMDALENDSELDSAIENIAIKMAGRKTVSDDFFGEYEVLKNSEYRFLVNLIDNLKDDGMMVVSLSQGFLAKNSLETLRKYLTFEKNYIDCIISLPDELSRKGPDVIAIFRKNKPTDDVVFIDLSMEYDLARNRYGVRGTFKSNLSLGRKTLNKVVSVYNRRETVNKFSNVVSLKEIVRNDFVLSTSRYVDTFEGDFIRLEDLKNQKEEITSNIKELNKKIEMMMDELGIDF